MARRRGHVALILTTLVTVLPGVGASLASRPAGAAPADQPVHSVVVTSVPGSGSTISTYPSFDQDVERFAIRSGQDVAAVSVQATSTDPGASVLVDGRPANNGETLVTGLEPGDEVNVQITDSAGTSNQSWILLPPGFPMLTTTGPRANLAEGEVFLTLQSWSGGTYAAVVDAHGVPARATDEYGNDFKQAATGAGEYSIATRAPDGAHVVRKLDAQFTSVREYRLAGDLASSTDFHDSVLRPDGGAVLMGYDLAERSGIVYTDAVLEVQTPSGVPSLTWNSKDHVDEDVEGLVDRSRRDYAHINSVQHLANGDLLASFRNLSQVMLIAGTDHDGHAQGDVIWRFGGLRNDFEVVDDPHGGPCAQHAATILANGHLMIFDNGGRRDDTGPIAPQTADMCPDPDDPTGPRIARPQSRVTEYVLDTSTTPPTATLVWSHEPTGRYAPFAGNAQRLSTGNTLVGWSQSQVPSGTTPPVATEVDPAGNEIWSLSAPGWFSYRAWKHPAPDRTDPEVEIASPVDGTTVQQHEPLAADFGCTDTGGSNLAGCTATVPHGSNLSSEVGTHKLTVTATDRSGNTTRRTVAYTVTAKPAPTSDPSPTPSTSPTASPIPALPDQVRPDAMVRRPGGRWRGEDAYGRRQRITLTTAVPRLLVAHVRVHNTGGAPGRVLLDATGSAGWARARWYAGGRDVTRRVVAGTWRTPDLDPGESRRLRLVVRVLDATRTRTRVVRVAATAPDVGGLRDVVRVRVKTRP